MFIKTTPLAVTLDGDKPRDAQNIIYLRADLTLSQHDAFFAEQRRMEKRDGGEWLTPRREEILIFFHRLCGWEGPIFAGVPFTRENVNLLDYDDPLVDAAIKKAISLHLHLPDDPEDPDPKANASETQPMSDGLAAG